MKIGFAQINPTVGDLRGNFEKIAGAYDQLARAGADIVIAPELAVTGYPPQDLVFKSRFVPENLAVLDQLQKRLNKPALLVGFVDRNEGRGKPFHNAAALLQAGEPLQKTHKSLLPTYDVFDEDRYFEPAREIAPLKFRGHRIGVTICEDIWTERYLPRPFYDVDPVRALVAQEAEMILNVSASPFSLRKPAVRREMISGLAGTYQRPIFYCNAVGGNDQLVFDGNSIAVNARGQLLAQLPAFEEASVIVDSESVQASEIPSADIVQELYSALRLGLRDYLAKCGFKSAVLGLSGGIDSAVVAAIAVDALGPNNVTGVSMPSQFSSRGSILDALALAKNLRIQCLEIPIADAFAVFKAQFKEVFAGRTEDATEENMQARLRGMTLMALSNKFGHLVLSTGNKSELAVGYCTIYGDMAGGLAVISDVPKTMIYELARFINSEASRAGKGEIIPASTIEKPPSAELRPNQKDQDTLPPYDVLDAILRLHVEDNLSVAEIVAQGFDEKTVRWVQRRVDLNEYKRAQAAPGLKVTSRAFGVGRRMPIAQRYVG
ncbi:MAG: NAD+ synthase [Verrucomicrobia bacterium]|nr:MAG: NAD+ synthase [Verrucomicrobiota bacterium]PYL99497.1 MAG: NAD+ synthase [Verrucomicrobiota bacterium]